MPPRSRACLTILAKTFSCLALCAFALADEKPQQGEDGVLEEVVVTGTRIPAILEEALPVTVMDEEAIANSGAINMPDILSHIPAVSGFEFTDSNTLAGGARGDVAAVNLRGLGSNNTLTLLNGRRMVAHPSVAWMSSVPARSGRPGTNRCASVPLPM